MKVGQNLKLSLARTLTFLSRRVSRRKRNKNFSVNRGNKSIPNLSITGEKTEEKTIK